MNKQLKQKMIVYAKANYVNVTKPSKCKTWDDAFNYFLGPLTLWINHDANGAIATTSPISADMIN